MNLRTCHDDVADHVRSVGFHRLEQLQFLPLEDRLHPGHVDSLLRDAAEGLAQTGGERLELFHGYRGEVGADDGGVLG